MGDRCLFAHSLYESWLHPSRFRTGMCAFGSKCSRKICFFAHETPDLRHRDPLFEQLGNGLAERDAKSEVGLDIATVETARAQLAARSRQIYGPPPPSALAQGKADPPSPSSLSPSPSPSSLPPRARS